MTQMQEKQWLESRWLPLFLFSAVVLLVGVDVVADAIEGAPLEHLLTEAAGAGAAAIGAGWSWLRLLEARQAAQQALYESRRQEESWRAEAVRWRTEARSLLQGLGAAIDEQFVRWSLTPSESEVAMLLLKGLSHQEVAAVRGTSERTARQHARTVYRKAGLSGRAELSAFFLEDLLLPPDGVGGDVNESGGPPH